MTHESAWQAIVHGGRITIDLPPLGIPGGLVLGLVLVAVLRALPGGRR